LKRALKVRNSVAIIALLQTCAEEISPAKAQRRNALPRFYGFSLRLCAFAGEIFFIDVPTLTLCAKLCVNVFLEWIFQSMYRFDSRRNVLARVIWFMELLLLMEAEAKSLVSGENLSYERSLKKELLEILEEIELLYGPRDRSYEMLGPRITECYYAHPRVYPSRKVRICLTREAKLSRFHAAYQLSHEAVHVLSPGSLGVVRDTLLEEGLATYFSFKYMKRVYGIQYTTTGHRLYDAALRGVSTLLAKNEFVIRELRAHQPVLAKIDEKLLVEVGGVEPELAKFLCQDFWSNWEPPVSWKTRAKQHAQLFARGAQSFREDWKI
jgi:hypothetical protein